MSFANECKKIKEVHQELIDLGTVPRSVMVGEIEMGYYEEHEFPETHYGKDSIGCYRFKDLVYIYIKYGKTVKAPLNFEDIVKQYGVTSIDPLPNELDVTCINRKITKYQLSEICRIIEINPEVTIQFDEVTFASKEIPEKNAFECSIEINNVKITFTSKHKKDTVSKILTSLTGKSAYFFLHF